MHMVDDQTPEQNQGDGEPLAPITYMLNFKLRRALMCRGAERVAEAEGRGFKKVSYAHFVKYLDNAKKGFRTKKKGARK